MSKRKTTVLETNGLAAEEISQPSLLPKRIQLLEQAWISFPESSERPVLTYVYKVGEIIRDPELIQLIIDRDILFHEV